MAEIIPLIDWTDWEKEWLRDTLNDYWNNIPEEEDSYYESQSSLLLEGNITEFTKNLKGNKASSRWLILALENATRAETFKIKILSQELTPEELKESQIEAERRKEELISEISSIIVDTIKGIKKKENPDLFDIKKTFLNPNNIKKITGNLKLVFPRIEEKIREHIGSINQEKLRNWLTNKLYNEVKEFSFLLEIQENSAGYEIYFPIKNYIDNIVLINLYPLIEIITKAQLHEPNTHIEVSLKGEPIIVKHSLPEIPIKTLNFFYFLYEVSKPKILEIKKNIEVRDNISGQIYKKYGDNPPKGLEVSHDTIRIPTLGHGIEVKKGELIIFPNMALTVIEEGEIANADDIQVLLGIMHFCKDYTLELRKYFKDKANPSDEIKIFFQNTPIEIAFSHLAKLLNRKQGKTTYESFKKSLDRLARTTLVFRKEEITEYKALFSEVSIQNKATQIILGNYLINNLIKDEFITCNREMFLSIKKTYAKRILLHLLLYMKKDYGSIKDQPLGKRTFQHDIKLSTLEQWIGIRSKEKYLRNPDSIRALRSRALKELKEYSQEAKALFRLKECELSKGDKGVSFTYDEETIRRLFLDPQIKNCNFAPA